jgi:hypothetical protein
MMIKTGTGQIRGAWLPLRGLKGRILPILVVGVFTGRSKPTGYTAQPRIWPEGEETKLT